MTPIPDAVHAQVAAFLARHHQLLIDGRWLDAQDGQRLAVENPATAQTIAHCAAGGAADVDLAVRAARRALEGPWGRMTPAQRTRLLLKLADAVDAGADEFALLETYDVGMPQWLSRGGAGGAGDVLRYFAGWATKIGGETSTPLVPGDWHAYTLREPVGVVGHILPWNSPYTMAITKIASSLAAGCTVVLKPAEQTPLSTLRLVELIQETGFPDGVVNLVTGLGAAAGAALVEHGDVDKIAFTGSTVTGKTILRASADTLKRVTLELGGKSPVIIMADADVDKAIEAAAGGIFLNSGQICAAGSRVYAHARIFDRVVAGIAERARMLKVGPGLDATTQMGPLVSQLQLDRVASFLSEDARQGAEVVAGGQRLPGPGHFLQPTVLANPRPTAPAVQQEIFGPVVCAMSFDDEDLDKIAAQANSTAYGLAASIWTRDISTGHKLAKRIKSGTVKINSREFPETTMPFGGFKQSGIGRERGRIGVEMYTEVKSVIVGL